MTKVGLLSCKIVLGFFEPTHPDALPHALHKKGGSAADLTHFTLDYQALMAAFKSHDIHCDILAWDNPNTDWSAYDAILIHTPWDYYEHIEAFLETLRVIDTHSLLLNPLNTVRWNIDKHYLKDLFDAGIPIINTIFVETYAHHHIADMLPRLHAHHGYILKPTISAGATDVYHIRTPEEAEHLYQTQFLSQHKTLMVQPFMKEIADEGEWSFIFLNGKYSHGVLKKTEKGGIGVKHSIQNKQYVPNAQMIQQAIKIYRGLEVINDDDLLYTRIDVIKDKDNILRVMEIEQIEPYLYLHVTSNAANQLVEGILRRFKK